MILRARLPFKVLPPRFSHDHRQDTTFTWARVVMPLEETATTATALYPVITRESLIRQFHVRLPEDKVQRSRYSLVTSENTLV